jgi:hypothetical protein
MEHSITLILPKLILYFTLAVEAGVVLAHLLSLPTPKPPITRIYINRPDIPYVDVQVADRKETDK